MCVLIVVNPCGGQAKEKKKEFMQTQLCGAYIASKFKHAFSSSTGILLAGSGTLLTGFWMAATLHSRLSACVRRLETVEARHVHSVVGGRMTSVLGRY